MAELVSVIVPVYNVEKYISKCLESIIGQTYKNIEIILVDDGSPDNSGKICDEYAELDSRINVIHKNNGGLSSARNIGIDNANGQYLCFIDSDDYIDENYVKNMLDIIQKEKCDVVTCNFKYIYEDGVTKSNNLISEYTILENEGILHSLLGEYYLLLTMPTNKLYSKKVFESLRYTEGIIHEDEDIAHKIMIECSKLAIIPEELYFYLIRENSIMTGSTLDKHSIMLKIMRDRHEYIYLKNCSKKSISISAYSSLVHYLIYANKYYEAGDKEKYKMILNESKVLAKTYLKRCLLKEKIKFFIKKNLCKMHMLSLFN